MKAIEISEKIAVIMEEYGPETDVQIEINGQRIDISLCELEIATPEMPTQNGLVIVIS